MATMVPAQKNIEYIFFVGLVSQADTKLLQNNPTLAAGDVLVSTDGGATSNLDTLPAVTPASSDMVKVTVSTSEMNGDNVIIVFSDAAGSEWCDLLINIQTSAQSLDTMDTNIDSVLTDTAVIGALGAGLTDLGGMSTTMKGQVNAEVDTALNTAIPASPVAHSVNERVKATDDKLPSATYLRGTADSDGGLCTADKNDINAEADTALSDINLDHLCKTATAGADMTTEVVDNSIISRMLASGDTSAFVPTTDSLQDIRDKQTDIETDTAVIGVLGAGLTAIPWNSAWDAEAQSECADALTTYDPPTKTEMDTAHALLATEAKQDIIDTNVDDIETDTGTTLPATLTAIKAKTDNLPSGVTKNSALANFEFLMVGSDDHISPAASKTVTATISKDGGAFAACSNSVSEVSNGVYKISLTATEMNANVITLKFTATNCDQRTVTILTAD